MIYRFGDDCELDTDRYEIRAGGEVVHVEPQVFDVLAYLVTNRDHVVSKEELLDSVWGDRFVSESALTSRLKVARQAVGDDGRRQAVIRTVHGRGYQFHAEVTEVESRPEVPSPHPAATGVPQPQGAILGRDEDLARLFDVVSDERLVTVLGTGGTGKTRFVTEFALGWPPERSAVAYVELAPVIEPTAVTDALANALSIQIGQRLDLREACVEYLRTVEHLLVVDNCEHVLDAVADLLAELLRSCPDLKVVTTSRVPLDIASEFLFRLDPLPVPPAGSEDAADSAVISLFARRARRADQSFVVDSESVEEIRALCEALDGLPLAVELAAGRLGAFDLGDLSRRLDRRLDLLGGSPDSGEDRHRTLRETLAWSYDLLEPDEQRLLRHLSIFPAGVTLAGVEWIGRDLGFTADPALVLSRLVDASMVVRNPAPSAARYVQLETVRAFGLDRLEHHDERDHAESLLIEWAAELCMRIDDGVRSGDEAEWHDRVRRSLPNLRAARQLMIDRGDLAAAASMSWGLDDWSRWRGQSEVWRWSEQLRDRIDDVPDEWRNRVTAMAAQAAWLSGRLDTTERLAHEVLGNEPTDDESLHAHRSLGTAALWKGKYEAAAEHWTASDYGPAKMAKDLASASIAVCYLGRYDEARSILGRARRGAEESGVPSDMCWVEYCTGEIEATEGTGRHEIHLDIAISEARRLHCQFMLGVAMVTRASHRARTGEMSAVVTYMELIDLWLRSGSWTQQWTTLRNVAELLVGFDDETAIRLWAAADVDSRASALKGVPAERRARYRKEVTDRLGEERVEKIEADARAMDRTDVVDDAAGALARLTADRG